MDTYRLLKLITNVHERVKNESLELDEEEELYNDLLKYADGDCKEE